MNRKSFLRAFGLISSSTVISSAVKIQAKESIKVNTVIKNMSTTFLTPYDKIFRCDVYKITELIYPSKAVLKYLNKDEVYVDCYDAKRGLLATRYPLQLDGAFIQCKAELIREKKSYSEYYNSIDPSLFNERDLRLYKDYSKDYLIKQS